jgi:MFS transporter, OFA family, oxalate/formate antiporter
MASGTLEVPSSGGMRGWVVTAAGLSINLVLGVLYAWSTIKSALVKDLHWSNTAASLPFAVATASFAVTMIFAGRVQDKIGPRPVAVLGGIMLGLGMIVSSFAHSPLAMSLTFGIFAGMGIGIGYSATTPSAIKWFGPGRKGLITGIVVSGVGLAPVYMAPVTEWLLKVGSISNAFLILGSGTIVVVGGLALLIGNPPAGYVPAAAAPTAAKKRMAAGRDVSWSGMLATPQFYLLWLMFVLAVAPGLMLIVNAKTIGADQVQGWNQPFVVIIYLSIANTLGRIGSGFVSDKIGRTNTMVLAFLIQAVNMFAFSYYTSAPLLLTGAAVAGLCYGAMFTLMPAATADFYGLKNLGVNYGILFTGFGVAGVTGSLLGGQVKDYFGSYHHAYVAVGVMLLGAVVLAFFTRSPKAPADAPAGIPAEPSPRAAEKAGAR